MPAAMTFAVVAAFTAFTALAAEAKTEKKQKRAAPVYEEAPREAGEPILAIVSIKSQQVTFYDAEGWTLRAPVSTGTTGRETPAGVFAIIEKEKEHYSTMYDDASMPNMQRITWNGIALHGGPLPGYAASHGCVRMPYAFAEKLFDKTRLGMRVIISPEDVTPADFSHPGLLVPNDEAIAAAPGRAETLVAEAEAAAKGYEESKKTAKSLAREVKVQQQSLRKLERLKNRTDAKLKAADKALASADQVKAKAVERQGKAAAEVADLATQIEAATATKESSTAPEATDADEKATARLAAAQKESLRKLERLKQKADAKLKSADEALAAAEQARLRAEERQGKASAEAAEVAKQVETAKAELEAKGTAAADAKEAIKTAKTRKEDAAKAALEAKLALEPVSVYISRATGMLYVRRNTHKPAPDGGGEVFDTSIEVPVSISEPERPIGTHIVTAMERGEEGLRWTAVTIDGEEDARAAFDRVSIPQEVLDRIAPTALPRSSIVISDEPLSAETNYRTEFVVVLNDHPQGGFITRKPTPKTEPEVIEEAEEKPPVSRWNVRGFIDF